ncbi:thiol reductant ABC exporter, CydC subunit [Gleimia coleocanis DSM 15436]|uniref:Thiol reductant ABC exporter, CydC subunit n=1 Tax=Gleimia coleocanis DSM 15436 TaxID=525245 RepID=C0VZE7_9ACTO|nr:thiol reductant ABC exporter subunit CydC [Gleimia coleocanis]EEH64248.1 thiol reductant ABC exporter, CydC subunit [Gleimia coleocanis DSM 15436]
MKLFVTASEWAALKKVLPLLELNKRQFALAILLGSLGLGASLGLAATSAWLIARASQHPPVLYLTMATVGVRFFGISKALLRYVQRLASHHVAMGGIAALRSNVYRKLAGAKTSTLAGLKRGDLLARTGSDVDALGDLLVKSVLPLCVSLVVGIGTVAGIAIISVPAAVVLAVALFLSGFVGPVLTARHARLGEIANDQARLGLVESTTTLLTNSPELLVSGGYQQVRDDISANESRLIKSRDKAAKPAAVAAAIDQLAIGIAVTGAILIGIPSAEAGLISVLSIAILTLVPLASFESTSELAAAAVQLVRSARAAERIQQIIEPDTLVKDAQLPANAAQEPVLEVKNLSVGWPGGPVIASGLNLTLQPGRSFALVGPSGIGKTTLLYTLVGMLEPVAGSVKLNGVNVHKIRGEEVGKVVSFTPEDAHIFATSVIENLRVANPRVTPEETAVLLDKAGLGTWFKHLHEQENTVLGSGGTSLSGGERRRMLLARAFANQAPLMLLDEPGEHLEPATADALVTDLLSVRDEQRGTLLVSHRVSALAAADQILVMSHEDGVTTISAQGTHEELLASCDSYRHACEAESAADEALLKG